ncbi:MAG TPA: ABC transporter transmembrane domain-containing protein [Actinomycetes bacterium]|nr:ABC transporter transmembrane domain-containing protein [Actinomycetes bacterium]
MNRPGDLRRSVALFRRFAVGQRTAFLVAMGLLVVEAATAVLQPVLIGDIVKVLNGDLQEVFRASGFDTMIAVLALALVGVTAVNSMSDSLAEVYLAKAGRTIGFNLRQALFAHLQTLSLAFHVRRRAGDVLTRITADVTALEDFVVKSVSDIAGSLLLISGTLVFLLGASPQVTLLALVMVPLLAVVSNAFASRIKSASKDLRAREGDLASTASEMLGSIGVVQIYGRNDYELRRFAAQSRSAMDAVFRTARLDAGFSFTVGVLEAGVIAVVVWVGAVAIGPPTITAGTLVTFVLLIQQMFKPTKRLIKQWNTIAKIYASVDRVGDLLDRRPAVVDLPNAVAAPQLRGEVEFDGVSFAYQASVDEIGDDGEPRLALDGVSFRVPAGEVVALVGHSGSGKSTIAQLIPRLYDPQVGAVLIDGHDVRSFTIESLRGQISMVLQEAVLFSGTVASNIAYGRPDATMDDVVRAARQANAHDFITALPQGYGTVLGERAANLSGGQRQRLSIARAFIRDAPVLILDEPTTGLDAESSDLVLDALRSLLRGRTALIITHDLNLIRGVDRVLVVSRGQILEDGSPADLLVRGGLYADLYERQFGARELQAADLAGRETAPALEMITTDSDSEGAEPRRRAFETALMQALPLPASPETFRQLTGRVMPAPETIGPDRDDDRAPSPSGQGPVPPPRAGAPPPPQEPPSAATAPPARSATVDGADLLGEPGLARWLPGLPDALDAGVMAPVLGGMLGAGWAPEWCAPGKALVQPGEGASLRYRLGVRELASGRVVEQLVGARMFDSGDAADQWLREQVVPLAERCAGRPDLRMFARPVQLVSALRLVLHAFPIDPDLPGLLAVTDGAHLAETLGPLLAPAVEDLVLQECRPHLVQYARRGRCVLRYDVLWQLGSSSRPLKQVTFGKVYCDDQGAAVGPAVTAVRAHLEAPSRPFFHFLVPGFIGYSPRLRFCLLEALPGAPQVAALVRQRVGGTDPADPRTVTLEEALDTCARIAATLHASGIELGPARTLAGEVDALTGQIEDLATLAPAVADALRSHLVAGTRARADTPGPVGFAHGDLTAAQVLFDGPLSGLVDLDTACQAEAALDLGQFVGYLDLMLRKAQWATNPSADGEAVAAHFLDAYLDSGARAGLHIDPDQFLDRVSAYRTVTLTRVALRSWLQLKPARLRQALSLLDERRPPQRPRAGTRHGT